MKNLLKKIPALSYIAKYVYRVYQQPFQGSKLYWEKRYETGGHSGDGSYNKLAEFKAEVLNKFVADNKIKTIIEFGCGDGNQLSLAQYPSYIGFDISKVVITNCTSMFRHDNTKTFKLMDEYNGEKSQLALSLYP